MVADHCVLLCCHLGQQIFLGLDLESDGLRVYKVGDLVQESLDLVLSGAIHDAQPEKVGGRLIPDRPVLQKIAQDLGKVGLARPEKASSSSCLTCWRRRSSIVMTLVISRLMG